LRVIADPAERALPPAALAGLRMDGGIDVGAVVASLAKSPRQLPGLIRLANEAGRARATLLRCSDLLGPRLSFRDLS
jgi:adenosylhomocysteine nucleosidase